MKESTKAHLRHTPRYPQRSIGEATAFAIAADAAAPVALPFDRVPDPAAPLERGG